MSKLSEKVLILGLDGMDPGLVNRFRAEGRMPNMDKYIQRGSSAKDLIMLGGVPTITPPMWTTLATGATPILCIARRRCVRGSFILPPATG